MFESQECRVMGRNVSMTVAFRIVLDCHANPVVRLRNNAPNCANTPNCRNGMGKN